MAEDIETGLTNEFFSGGWRLAPFIKSTDGYIGVKAWPKRAATNMAELYVLVQELSERSSKTPIFGVVPPKGRYVVDIDHKKNPKALELWISRVKETMGEAALGRPNLIVKTKSGGYHLYYSDGSDRQINSPIGVFQRDSGIDIRGYTGMVVAPTYVGTEDDWQVGDYAIVKGRPTSPPTVLQLYKVLGGDYDSADLESKSVLAQINEALRNDSVRESDRFKLVPDSLLIPSSSRDNTLFKCAKLCRAAGLSQDAAVTFMTQLAGRCETSPEEPAEHWRALALDKVKRVYSQSEGSLLQSISALYEELDNSGTVLLRTTNKSFYYFRHGSSVLRIEPRSMYSTENFPNVVIGLIVKNDEGDIPLKKLIPSYMPKEVAYGAAMYPKGGVHYFDYEDRRYVNTYHDPFATFEPKRELLDRAKPYVEAFYQFTRHITGYNEGDDQRLLDKLAWIVQKPYRRLPTGTIIFSHTKGTGKDSFMLLIREIVGRKYYMPINLAALANEHTILHDKIVCAASEVQLTASARGSVAASSFMGTLKDMITAKHVVVNEKFNPTYKAPIFTNFFVLSNFNLSPIIESDDRRWDMFHATEEKMDQKLFGKLVDVGNDGIWVERSAEEREFRRHVIFSLRESLLSRAVRDTFDREEAAMNSVKVEVLENHNPPSVMWLTSNLPTYFTEEAVMMACFFSPTRIQPEYAMKQMRDHLGPAFRSLYRGDSRSQYRVNGAPKLELRADASGSRTPILNFDVSSSSPADRRPVYYIERGGVRDTAPTDSSIKADLRKWYLAMMSKYQGTMIKLPAEKPDVV